MAAFRLQRVQEIVTTNTNAQDAFYQVHEQVQPLPLLERLLPLLKAMERLKAPIPDGVERLLSETIIQMANQIEDEMKRSMQKTRSAYDLDVFLFLFVAGRLSGTIFANNRRSLGLVLLRSESFLLHMLSAHKKKEFRLCTEIFVWLWGALEDESKPKSNQKILAAIIRLLSPKRKHPDGPPSSAPLDRLFDSFLYVEKPKRPYVVHILWKLNKRMMEQTSRSKGGLVIVWPLYMDALRVTYESKDGRLEQDAIEQLDLFVRFVDPSILPRMREVFERLGLGMETPIIKRATERILERFGPEAPTKRILVAHYVQRFLDAEKAAKEEFPPVEYRILELLMRYASPEVLEADESLQILNRLTADVDRLLANWRRLRLFSVFLERRDLRVPIPIDLTICVLLKTHSLNGRLLEPECRVELERCRKFVAILLHSRQFYSEMK